MKMKTKSLTKMKRYRRWERDTVSFHRLQEYGSEYEEDEEEYEDEDDVSRWSEPPRDSVSTVAIDWWGGGEILYFIQSIFTVSGSSLQTTWGGCFCGYSRIWGGRSIDYRLHVSYAKQRVCMNTKQLLSFTKAYYLKVNIDRWMERWAHRQLFPFRRQLRREFWRMDKVKE